MPRSNKPICTKNPTNPRNFANPKIKLANLKIPPTKHKKKKKKKTQTEIWLTKTQKEKKKKTKPNRLWVCNGWGVVHGGCGDFSDWWEFQLVGEVLHRLIVAWLVGKDFLGSCFLGLIVAVVAWVSCQLRGAWSLEGGLSWGLITWVETWE